MKLLLENWRRHITEAYTRAADEEHTPEKEFENQVINIAKQLGVKISIEEGLDGVLQIKVYGRDESHSPYNDPDDELIDRLDESQKSGVRRE